MKTRAVLFALTCAMGVTAAHADTKGRDEKFCAALTEFRGEVAQLEGLGPNSTMAELRAATDRVRDSAQKVEKTAHKIKSDTSKQFDESVNTLRKEVRGLPSNITIEQAKTRVGDDIKNVRESGRKLAAESGCPAPTE